MSVLATYIAGLCDHTDALVPGERGVLLCMALDQRVAKIILDYSAGSIRRQPDLAAVDLEPHRRCDRAYKRRQS